MIMLLLLKQKAHLFVSPSHQTTLNSALQRALKHFNNACSTTRGSISIWSIDVTIKLQSTTKVKSKKNQFSKQTGYKSNISIPYDGQKNHDLEFFLDPSHQPDLSFWQNTAICRSCVQIQSHELRMPLHFPKLHDKALSLWVKDTLRQKHAFALCTKRKQSFSDHDDHKIQRWFLFFLFKSKTNKKGEKISNIQPVYESLQDFPKTVFISNLTNPSRTSLLLLSYKIPSERDVVISCKERQKWNINLHKPKGSTKILDLLC